MAIKLVLDRMVSILKSIFILVEESINCPVNSLYLEFVPIVAPNVLSVVLPKK